MRKLTTIIAFAAMFCMSHMAFAQQWEIGGVKYEANGNSATVTGHTFDTKNTNIIFLRDEVKDSKGNIYKVEAIGKEAFANLSNLQFVYGGKYIKELVEGAFHDSGLMEADFPNVEKIELGAFRDCRSLVRVNMPNLTEVPQEGFIGCGKLSEVNMPKIKSIGVQGFQQSGIVHADFPELETIAEDGMAACQKLITFYAPKLDSIGKSGLYKCDELKIAEFGASLKELSESALRYCSAIQSLTFHSPVPPKIGTDALKWNGSGHNIYVPAESLEAYKKALSVSGTTIRPIADYTLSVSTSDNALGKCLGGGTFASGTEVEILAIARNAGIFRQWSDGVTDNPRTVKLYENTNLTAQFEEAIPLNAPTEGGMHMVVNLNNDCRLEIPNDEVAQVYILDEGDTYIPVRGTEDPEDQGSANALRLNFVGDYQPIEREHLLTNTILTYCEDGDEIHFQVDKGMVTYPLTTLCGFSFFNGTPSVQLTAKENPMEPGDYYTSFYSGLEEYELPEGVTAFKAVLDGDNVVLDYLSSPVIPRREAVILLSNQTDVQLTISNTGVADSKDNLLWGYDVATTVPAPGIFYGLMMDEGKLGFKKQEMGDVLYPNIAYVRDQEVDEIVFSDNTTDITTMPASENQATRYDLTGRRVGAGYRGLVVSKGRVVLQK